MGYTDLKLGAVVLCIPHEESRMSIIWLKNGADKADFLSSQGSISSGI